MKRSSSYLAVFAFLLVAPLSGLSESGFSQQPAAEPQLTVRVYNYAGFSAKHVQKVGAVVISILGKAGIQTRWLDCRPASTEILAPSACREFLGPTDLVLRLSDQAAVLRPDSQGVTLANALATAERGALATVFCGSIEMNARENWASRIQLLGYSAAHEIGHLLLGSRAHTKEGIMRPCWDKQDKLRMASLSLLFSKDQSEQLQRSIAARQQNAERYQSSVLNDQ